MVFPSTGLDDGLVEVFNQRGKLYREIVMPRCFRELRVSVEYSPRGC